jgi:holo-[acyl-carrier protein] synthase
MKIVGIGTDIIEVDRIEGMIQRHGDLFLRRVYTSREIEYCAPRKAHAQHFAGRWAAKEAVLKTLGTGWARGIQWTDIELINRIGGQPEIALHGAAATVAAGLGITEIQISISHCRAYAVAFATALNEASV